LVRTCSGFIPRRSRFDEVTFIRVGHAQDRRFNPGHEYVFFLHFTACALLSSALPNFWPHRERPSYNVTSSILGALASSLASKTCELRRSCASYTKSPSRHRGDKPRRVHRRARRLGLVAVLQLRLSAACSRVACVSRSHRRAAEAPPAAGSLHLKLSEQQQSSKRAQGRCLGLYGSAGWVCEYDEPAALCFFRRTKSRPQLPTKNNVEK